MSRHADAPPAAHRRRPSRQLPSTRSQRISISRIYHNCDPQSGRIKVDTDGRLVIEPFAAGTVMSVFESLDAVGAGVLQAHSSWPGYFSCKNAGLADLSFTP